MAETRIKVLPDGSRQRWGPGKGHTDACDTGCVCDTGPRPLPRIPDWPLHGQAPQYLRQLRGEDRFHSGDSWRIVLDADGDGKADEIWATSMVLDRPSDGMPAHTLFRVHARLTVPTTGPIKDAYLVAKADPEADG